MNLTKTKKKTILSVFVFLLQSCGVQKEFKSYINNFSNNTTLENLQKEVDKYWNYTNVKNIFNYYFASTNPNDFETKSIVEEYIENWSTFNSGEKKYLNDSTLKVSEILFKYCKDTNIIYIKNTVSNRTTFQNGTVEKESYIFTTETQYEFEGNGFKQISLTEKYYINDPYNGVATRKSQIVSGLEKSVFLSYYFETIRSFNKTLYSNTVYNLTNGVVSLKYDDNKSPSPSYQNYLKTNICQMNITEQNFEGVYDTYLSFETSSSRYQNENDIYQMKTSTKVSYKEYQTNLKNIDTSNYLSKRLNN